MVSDQTTALTASLFESGVGADILATWVSVLNAHATDLVDAATITSDADSIASFFTGS
ncbi:MAG: hypothetical protein QM753_07650 [Thermomicrobiales bacterium]